MVGILEAMKGITDAADEYLGDQEEGFYFEGISKRQSRQREIILRDNGTISALKLLPKYRGQEIFLSSLLRFGYTGQNNPTHF